MNDWIYSMIKPLSRNSRRPRENSAAHLAQPEFRGLWASRAEKIANFRSPRGRRERRIDFCTVCSASGRAASDADRGLVRVARRLRNAAEPSGRPIVSAAREPPTAPRPTAPFRLRSGSAMRPTQRSRNGARLTRSSSRPGKCAGTLDQRRWPVTLSPALMVDE